MKAWQFTEVGSPLSLNEVETPTPAADEVAISVKAVGLCHSDVGFVNGTLAEILPFHPITLGHEIAGVVSAVGSDVTAFAVGQKVVVPASLTGPGVGMNGGFAVEVVVSSDLVLALPDGVPFDQAAAATDAGLTSFHAVSVKGRVTSGSRVGIIGFGGLGSLGAERVESSISAFEGENLDVVIDIAGYGSTTDGAIPTLRPGGRIVVVGLGVARAEIDLQALTLKELEIVGSKTGSKEDCAAVLDLIADGQLTSRIDQITFGEIGEGISKLQRGEVIGRLVAVL
jgi:propanol-preferring alcohol dehydrogenase